MSNYFSTFVDVALTGDLMNKPKTPATAGQQAAVSFAEGTHFDREKTGRITFENKTFIKKLLRARFLF